MREGVIVEQIIFFVDADGDGAVVLVVVVELVVLEDSAAGIGRHSHGLIEFMHHLRVGGESDLFCDLGNGEPRVAQHLQTLGDAQLVDGLHDGLSRLIFELSGNIGLMISHFLCDLIEGDLLIEVPFDVQLDFLDVVQTILFIGGDALGDLHKKLQDMCAHTAYIFEKGMRVHEIVE